MDIDSMVLNNISYIRARDPSIVTFGLSGRDQLSNVKTNLMKEFGEPTANHDEGNTVRVYLRIKKGYNYGGLYVIQENSIIAKVPPGSSFLRNMKDGDNMSKTYKFTKIFEPETSQTDIFNHIVKRKMLDFINGQNSSLFTYGVSGSGKTFTLIGTDEEPGVIPRSLEYLFRTIPQLAKHPVAKPSQTGTTVCLINETESKKEKLKCKNLLNQSTIDRAQHMKIYSAMQQRLSNEPVGELEELEGVSAGVWISFAEIYNEQIFDLLVPDPPLGKQRPRLRLGTCNGHAYIKNLTNVNVTSGQEAFQILQYGLHKVNYAPTQLNQHSSRSHCIFTIRLVQYSESDGGTYISSFNFCDLAGSERSKKTQNVGDRLKESNNINSSLLVLGRCIAAVRNLQKQNDITKVVPFRESKLTQLFQKALAGSEDIAMIVNMSPSRDMFDETQHVLLFSAIAKDISIEHKPEPIFKKKGRFSQLVESKSETNLSDGSSDADAEHYKNIIDLLKDELETKKQEYEVSSQMDLDFIRQEYDKIIQNMKESHERKLERAKQNLATSWESKLRIREHKYEQMIKDLKNKNTVILIDDDDDKDEKIEHLQKTLDEAVAEFQSLQEKYRKLEEEHTQLKSEFYKIKFHYND